MTLPRRRFLHLAGAAAVLPVAPRFARAQSWPARPVHLVVAFPAGSGPDIVARLAGAQLSKRLGQQFVIENKPGAASNIGTEYVAKAAPDGYTILMPVSTNTVNVALYRNLNFDFIRDIAPIAGFGRTTFVIAVPASFPPRTLAEFIAYLKAHPGKVNMGSAGIGGVQHVSGALFQLMTGTSMQHVPYRGDFIPDLIAGQVQVVWVPIASALPLVRDGKLRALAVTTRQRVPALPDVPAVDEFVKGYESFGWYGLGAPSRTPREIIGKLAAAMNEAMADSMMQERLAQLGVDPMPLMTDAFAKHIAEEVDKWARVIKAQGIQVN
ncbi:MAG: tripartite tricarboxylate transporter substrate binding protein [Xanthobacteraceae bacterium]|nr:tripartite tricarboxylate transporter substrate binding protein [Xanthobacteraceae bacterium]